MKHHRRYIGGGKPKLPHLVFTLQELLVLDKALGALEQRMRLTTKPLPNLALARATVTLLQTKITAMMQLASDDQGEHIAFDANEVLLMETAIVLFRIGVQETSASLERENIIRTCQVLAQKISTVKQQVHTKI